MDCEKWRTGSGQVHVYVQRYKDVTKVHIRNFKPTESGKMLPTVKGVTLDSNEWELFKTLIQTVDSEFKRQMNHYSVASEENKCYYEVGEIPPAATCEIVCPSFEGNH